MRFSRAPEIIQAVGVNTAAFLGCHALRLIADPEFDVRAVEAGIIFGTIGGGARAAGNRYRATPEGPTRRNWRVATLTGVAMAGITYTYETNGNYIRAAWAGVLSACAAYFSSANIGAAIEGPTTGNSPSNKAA